MKENPPAINSICQSFHVLFKWLLYLMLKMWKWLAGIEWCRIDRKGGKAAGIQPLCSASLQHGREAIVDTHAHHAHRCLCSCRCKTHIKAFTHTGKHTLAQMRTPWYSLPTAPSSLPLPRKHTSFYFYLCKDFSRQVLPSPLPFSYLNHCN